MNSDETLIWKGSPSQWVNIGFYLFCLVLAAAVIPVYLQTDLGPLAFAFLAVPLSLFLIRWLLTSSRIYEITSERIRTTTGLLSRTTTEVELYRVRDYTVFRPFGLRLVGRGNLILQTSDRTTPQVVLHALPNVEQLKDEIRANTERIRMKRGVRDPEIDTPDTPDALP
jgi:uncharacterized membrane protein YdbT with pleckstrin-like domain